MRVAVTGATGGLGRSLTEFLVHQKVEVVALGRNKSIGQELVLSGSMFRAGNISDKAYVKAATRGCDVVVHCAGLASPWGAWENFYEANVAGTESVLEAMRENGIKKLVHISTPSLYFSGEPEENIREDRKLPTPTSFYARSKLMADELVQKEVATQGISAVLLRPRAFFGKYDNTVIPRILRLLEKGFFPLPNGGESKVDVTAVENVIHAIWLAINSKKQFKGDVFNITNGEPMTVKELTHRLATSLGWKVRFVSVPFSVLISAAKVSEFFANHVTHREPTISKYSIQSIGTTQTLSIEKAKSELGYTPILSISQALENYIKGWKG